MAFCGVKPQRWRLIKDDQAETDPRSGISRPYMYACVVAHCAGSLFHLVSLSHDNTLRIDATTYGIVRVFDVPTSCLTLVLVDQGTCRQQSLVLQTPCGVASSRWKRALQLTLSLTSLCNSSRPFQKSRPSTSTCTVFRLRPKKTCTLAAAAAAANCVCVRTLPISAGARCFAERC